MSLLFNTLSRFVIVLLPKSKHLLVSQPQSPSSLILEPNKIKSVSASTFSPSLCHEVIPIPKKSNAKECSNYCTIALISHASKVILKILQARLQQYVNRELPDVQAGFRKGRKPEIKLPTSTGSSKKQENSRKNMYFSFIDYAKAFESVDHNKLWKILKKRGNTRPPDLLPEKPIYKSGSNS